MFQAVSAKLFMALKLLVPLRHWATRAIDAKTATGIARLEVAYETLAERIERSCGQATSSGSSSHCECNQNINQKGLPSHDALDRKDRP
ncbi:hypothetical protein [Caballeronia sp. Lep1P3]|uniref:hypothetical protein n=1 Tax=Caballeronia sp. Lep1P3 TaxID=2878150 RepID=UPI001FD3CAB7|nr:hypothetical protein [Caballeronia sp. Lep1P3]